MRQSLEILRWRAEIAGVRTGLWLFGRVAEPVEVSADLQRFFVDRYVRLGNHHRARGRHDRARRLFAQAVLHWRAISLDDPPPSVTAVMPVPLPPIFTWVVAAGRLGPVLRKAA